MIRDYRSMTDVELLERITRSPRALDEVCRRIDNMPGVREEQERNIRENYGSNRSSSNGTSPATL